MEERRWEGGAEGSDGGGTSECDGVGRDGSLLGSLLGVQRRGKAAPRRPRHSPERLEALCLVFNSPLSLFSLSLSHL